MTHTTGPSLSPLPERLVESLSPSDRAAVEAWWAQLPDDARQELALSCDLRAASCEYSLVRETPHPRWEGLPILVGAQFIPSDEPDTGEDWNVDFYEYLVNNPELGIHFNGRTFHICRAHPVARALLRQGLVPAKFGCPQADSACPMEHLLRQRPGCRVALYGTAIPSHVASAPEQALDHLADALDDA